MRKIEESQMICPLCKMAVDERDEEIKKDHPKTRIPEIYPVWVYVQKGVDKENNLPDHLINFHRLPTMIAGMFATGLAIGSFLKERPEFEVEFPKTKETSNIERTIIICCQQLANAIAQGKITINHETGDFRYLSIMVENCPFCKRKLKSRIYKKEKEK